MTERVRQGYDRIAESYAASREYFDSLPYLERFAATLRPEARVLDLGCGAGLPVARFLTDAGYQVDRIDFSPRMVELAGVNVPEASFEVRDMLTLSDAEYRVDGIVAFYSIFHVDRREHQGLFKTLRTLLPEDGVLLATMGADDWEGTEPDFHGAEMVWSHYGPERNRAMLQAAGFEIILDEIDTTGNERHQVLLLAIAKPGTSNQEPTTDD